MHVDDDIRTFWKWFATVADELARNFQNRALLDSLDARLRKLGPVRWEFGEGTFAISPDGDSELLPLTQRIVALAPSIDGWEFLAARPATEAPPKFTFNIDGRKLVVDPMRWRYVLTRNADQFDVALEQVNLPSLSAEDSHAAAVVVVDAMIGEAKRLALVRNIEPVSAFTVEQSRRASAITKLSSHLDSLSRPAARA